MRLKLQILCSCILSTLLATDSFAVGAAFIGNEVLSARSAGQGYVGIAGQNEDPTTVYSNPGAMTSLKGTQATFGMHWENVHSTYEDPSGNETQAHDVNVVIPNFAMTQSFMDGKLAAGLSSQSPFGLETNWPGDSPLRYVATNSRLGMVNVTPAVAYKFSSMFSFGAGADYANVFRAQLDKHLNNDVVNVALGGSPSGDPDAVSSLRGTGAGWGYHVGGVFQPTEQHALGVVYHSKINIRVNGNLAVSGLTGANSQFVFGGANYETSAYTDLVLPSNVQLGYAFKPNSKWHFEVDTAWYHWSESKDVNVRFPAATPTQAALLTFNQSNISKLDLHDGWSVATGANYKMNDRWQLRSGFWYEPWASPESTFNPAFNDLSRYGLSAGFGFGITENLTLDAAYTAVFFHTRHISNDVGAQSAPGNPIADIDGVYSDFANLVALNLTYRFGNK